MVRTATEGWKLRAGNALNRTGSGRSCSSGRKARGVPPFLFCRGIKPRRNARPGATAGASWRPVRGPAGAVFLAAPPVFQLPFTAVSPGSGVPWVRPCRPAGRRRSASAPRRRPFPARTRSQPTWLPAPFRRAWPVSPSSPCWNRAERSGVRRRSRPWVSLLAACVHPPWDLFRAPGWSRLAPAEPGRDRRGWRGCVQAWVGAPVSPGRPLRFGYLCFAPPVPGRLVRERCGAVRPAQGARRGVVLPGNLAGKWRQPASGYTWSQRA